MSSNPTPFANAERTVTSLERGLDALVSLQRRDGSWEGECVWNPMLAAQYTIVVRIMDLDLSDDRRRGLLLQFRSTRNPSGLWGLHPFDGGSLFVTTLVYVAARLLGTRADAPWLAGARRLFAEERVERIPTWGKVWLSVLGLYDWDGVNPILPEVWRLPTTLPIHPASYYCHTRAIYAGLAVLYGERFKAEDRDEVPAIRSEIYGGRYETIDFVQAAGDVREADAPFRPGQPLRALFRLMRAYERVHSARLRTATLARLRNDMREHLRASHHLGLSPVNGLLIMLALFIEDPRDPDLQTAVARMEDWFWEDDREGSRIAGAGSVCWDTAFALQALGEFPDAKHSEPVTRAASFLASQQVGPAGFDYEAAFRIDPNGGWCFSEVGHQWPVSDCTAEALLALLRTRPETLGQENAARAARFILRCQNRDGGFGSYEPRKSIVPLEWMNPAEMFGGCMTERSYVECTASCIIAMSALRRHYPGLLRGTLPRAIGRAGKFLREGQDVDGSWEAAWGIDRIYATMFGVRGLLAADVSTTDPHIRDACRWLLSHQRTDGGWGEHHSSAAAGRYVDAERASSIQTAWALITLCEARDPDRTAADHAAAALRDMQLGDGTWPDGEYVGVFFETALLNYRLYRQYFPVMALAMHEHDHAPTVHEIPRRLS